MFFKLFVINTQMVDNKTFKWKWKLQSILTGETRVQLP